MEAIFFNDWFTFLRTAVVGILAYGAGLSALSHGHSCALSSRALRHT